MQPVLMALLLCASCGPTVEVRAAAVGRHDGDVDQGASVFANSCASCHGTKGEGTAEGIPLGGHFAQHGVEALAAIVIGGEGTMAPQPGLSDQHVADVIAYGRAKVR